MSDEKTEEPTEHKLREARKKGQVAKSQDVNGLAITACALLTLSLTAEWAFARLTNMLLRVDQVMPRQQGQDISLWAASVFVDGVIVVLPVLVVVILVGLSAGVVQVGLQISFEPVMPKFDALNPIAGLKKIFSLKALMEVCKSVVIIAVMGAVIWVNGAEIASSFVALTRLSPSEGFVAAGSLLWQMSKLILLVWLVYALADWTLQKVLFLKDQRMSKDEIKREYKESEGDPLIKGQRKQIAMEIANEAPKPKGGVAGSNLMVTNPTHLAVALYHGPDTPVPIISALGADEEAARLRCMALESSVIIIEDVPLARAMFPLGAMQAIEPEMFHDVLDLMVWAEQLNQLIRSDTD